MMQMHAESIFVVDEDATAEMRIRTVDYYKGLTDVHYRVHVLLSASPNEVL